MNSRSLVSLALAFLVASTLYTEFAQANELKKKVLLKGLVGASILLKYMKPKKGILPIPLPIPLPLPIEWEQPPVIVHPKQHHMPMPEPIRFHHHQPYPYYAYPPAPVPYYPPPVAPSAVDPPPPAAPEVPVDIALIPKKKKTIKINFNFAKKKE
ncbi:hypothetical protein HDE_09594 [Halotydeus destructor]|nr:hypothetical protein HDE_09594 [Halotydeus destructor]